MKLITVARAHGNHMEIPTIAIHGAWAVHSMSYTNQDEFGWRFGVTHIKSGLRACRMKTKEGAIAMARLLDSEVGDIDVAFADAEETPRNVNACAGVAAIVFSNGHVCDRGEY